MKNRVLALCLSLFAFLFLASPLLYAGAVPTAHGPGEKLFLFNFAPESSRTLDGFVKVSASTVYDKTRGFGWLDLKGKVAAGSFDDPALPWEGCDNLNVITRPAPDDVGRTFVAGTATFVVDLPDGKYELWLLVGDEGFRDYVPHEPFSILAGKDTVFKRNYKPADCYAAYETVPPDDTISEYDAYARYVRPRFEWKKAEVNVRDGRLALRLNCPERVADSMKFSAVPNDLTLGPAHRFTGSLCALMLSSETPNDTVGFSRIEMLEAYRAESFARRFPRLYHPPIPAEPTLAKTDTRRGYTLFFPYLSENVAPNTFRPHEEKSLSLRATPGESLPITFAVYATDDLKQISVSPGYLRTKSDSINPKSFDVTQVRYVASVVEKLPDAGFRWQPAAGQLVPLTEAPLPKGSTRQFWLTLNVPADAKPGSYAGKISVNPMGGQSMSIDLTLQVLPFTLQRPESGLAVVYIPPVPESYFDEKRMWDRVRADLADIHAHGFVMITLLGVAPDNKPALDKFSALCKESSLILSTDAPLAALGNYFNGYNGLPHDFFDAGIQPRRLAYPGEKFSVLSTPSYELFRRGIDHLAYLNTLNELATSAPAGPAKTQAEQALAQIIRVAAIPKTPPPNQSDIERSQIIDAILKLNPAPAPPPTKKK